MKFLTKSNRENGGATRKTWRAIAAMLLALALLLTGMVAPVALADGDSSGQDGTGGGGSAGQFWAYKDGALSDENDVTSGSWGKATDINSVSRAMAAAGVTMDDTAGKAATALKDAREGCESGFKTNHPNDGDAECRVVAVGAVSGNGTSDTSIWNGSGIYSQSVWLDNWNKYVASNKYYYSGTQQYETSTPFNDDPNTSVNSLMEKEVTSDDAGICPRSIVIIVLDKYQPAPAVPPTYDLSGSTQAASGITTAGQVGSVRDRLTLSRNGSSITENVNGKVTMYWRGVDGTFLVFSN